MSGADESRFTPTQHRFDELPAAECLHLLAGKAVGRLGFTGPRGPQILPINHAVRGSEVVFRTAAYNSIAGYVRGSRVAFEVDEIDDSTRTGWSVLVVGTARPITEPDELVEVWRHEGPEPWAPGTRTLYMAISPERITGRRIRPV